MRLHYAACVRAIPSLALVVLATGGLAWAGPADQDPVNAAVHALIDASVDDLFTRTAEEMEKRAKKDEKGGPKLSKDESKPDLGYQVYVEGAQRSYFHNGKMIRVDKVGPKGIGDALQKEIGARRKGARFDWMERPEKGDEVCHWDVQRIVQKGDVQIAFTFTFQITTRKGGAVILSVMDTEGALACGKAMKK